MVVVGGSVVVVDVDEVLGPAPEVVVERSDSRNPPFESDGAVHPASATVAMPIATTMTLRVPRDPCPMG